MSNDVVALSIILGIIFFSVFLAFYSGSRRKMNLEQWTVAGRGFGVVLVWLLMAGEIYTTFAFLGASGWAYSRGGPVLYIVAYLTLAYVVSFYILPQIWEVGTKFQMQTQSDFFHTRYKSKYLAACVSLVAVVFMIPYLQLQLNGLGIIMEVCSYGGIGRTAAMLMSFALVAGFVLFSGVRAVAWISVIKDILMLGAAVFVGIGLPYMYFGGIGEMFTALIAAKPSHLTMPGSTTVMGHSWFISTVILTSCGFYMWPHFMSATFTAKTSDTIMKNAVILPIYTITMPLILFVGFTAVLIMPNISNGDMTFLSAVQMSFSPAVLGIIGGAGALTAMVPAAIIILSAATLFAKNFYRPILSPNMSDDQVATLAKVMVIVITLISLYFAIYSSTTLVALLLLGYAGVTQFFPGVVFGLYWDRVTKYGIFAGIVTGISVIAFLMLNKMDPFMGLNAGFLGLCANFTLAVIVSLLTPAEENCFNKPVTIINK